MRGTTINNFDLILVFWSCFKCIRKDVGAFDASSFGLVDVVGSKKGVEDKKSECKCSEGGADCENKEAYDSKFYWNCWWWWWVKVLCWSIFCFIIFVSFWFIFSFWYFIMYFCFNGDKKLSEDYGFNSNIKDGVYGNELLQVSNLVCSFFI